ncbi:MAG TPA: hypothetical protein VL221_01110, partial [Bacteroidota bacterium]|nr:hypothetical protein [Bacteroidota bacterium]
MKRTAACALACALIAGCSTSPETVRTGAPPAPNDGLARWEADFRPSDHDTLSAAAPRAGAASTGSGRDTSSGAPSETASELVPGFRVQIFSTTDIDEANQKKAEAEADFPTEWFYIQ